MMNPLMTLAVADTCSAEVCKNCSQVVTQSAWDGVIRNIPVIVVLVLLSVVFIFLVGYAIEYIKLKAQYLKQAKSNTDQELQDIKNIVSDINSKINKIETSKDIKEIEEKFRQDLENWEKSIKIIKSQNKELNEKIDNLINEKKGKKQK